MSDNIDWSKAPEGATHYNKRCSYPWLRDGDIVAYFADERGWRDYGVPAGGRRAINEAVPRPPISEGPLRAEEFDPLVEPDWSQAPEGATHYNSRCAWPWLRDGKPPAYFVSGEGWHDYGAPAIGRRVINEALPRPAPQPDRVDHLEQPWLPDDAALQDFATAQSRRLAQCRAAGRSGWDDPEQCPPQRLAEGLVRAVRAGKLVDVGNYAMMLWKRTNGRGLPPGGVARWIGEALERQGTPSLSDFIVVQPKAEPTEWDGTGLPPVGTVCEFNAKYRGWVAVTIAAHVTKRSGTPFVLFDQGDDSWHWESDPKRLRPILTPEQRSAKERDEAVAAMLKVLESNSSMQVSDVMGSLYDAGWRKTEVE